MNLSGTILSFWSERAWTLVWGNPEIIQLLYSDSHFSISALTSLITMSSSTSLPYSKHSLMRFPTSVFLASSCRSTSLTEMWRQSPHSSAVLCAISFLQVSGSPIKNTRLAKGVSKKESDLRWIWASVLIMKSRGLSGFATMSYFMRSSKSS